MNWQPPQQPGQPPQQYPAPQQQWGGMPPGSAGTNGKAVASMVLGICGFIVCPLVCSILAIIFGKQAEGEIALNPQQGGAGMARAGVIMGIVGLVLGAVAVIFWIVIVVAAGSGA